MKKIHKCWLAVVSGILTMLGFGSCKTIKYVDVSQQLSDKQEEVTKLTQENKALQQTHKGLQRQIEELSNPPKVYGPPPVRR